MSTVEIDSTVLLKINYSLTIALRMFRHWQDIKKELDPTLVDIAIDNLSDAVCRIEDKVRKVKEEGL